MNSSMNNSFQTEQQLSAEEIVIIRKEKRMGYIFASLILMFGLLLNLWIILDSAVENKGVLLIIDPLIVLISYFICRLVNSDLNKDLRAGVKTIITETVQKKEARYVGEAGSGVLYIPILGDLFPKLWGLGMRMTSVFKLVIGSVRYTVEEETYANVEEGSAVKMHFAPNSKILLKVEKV
ncbi:MAG: hypothetical protein HGA83_06815 [Bacteroidales bacterium]|nr:hypothetical protein [Bacteroidales bacterium]